MKAPQLLNDLQARGVMLQANGDRLHFDGPRDALTPQVLAEVKRQKFALLLLLKHSRGTARAPETQPTAQPAPDTTPKTTPTEYWHRLRCGRGL